MLWLAWLVSAVDATCTPEGFDPNYFPGGDSRTWACARTAIGAPSEPITDWSRAAGATLLERPYSSCRIMSEVLYIHQMFSKSDSVKIEVLNP